jgi:hypothetical protein
MKLWAKVNQQMLNLIKAKEANLLLENKPLQILDENQINLLLAESKEDIVSILLILN